MLRQSHLEKWHVIAEGVNSLFSDFNITVPIGSTHNAVAREAVKCICGRHDLPRFKCWVVDHAVFVDIETRGELEIRRV